MLAYLYDGTQEVVDVAADAVDAAAERIRESMAKMQAKLRDVPDNVAHRDDFPLNEDQDRCHWCNFKQLCFGGAGVPGAQLAGDRI